MGWTLGHRWCKRSPSFKIQWRRYYFAAFYKQWKQKSGMAWHHGKWHMEANSTWIWPSGCVSLPHAAMPHAWSSSSPNKLHLQRWNRFIKLNSEDTKIIHFVDLASWIASGVAVVDCSVIVANTTARQKFHAKRPKRPIEIEVTLS